MQVWEQSNHWCDPSYYYAHHASYLRADLVTRSDHGCDHSYHGWSRQLESVIMLKRVITCVITPITGWSHQLESMITLKRVITGVITGVICDHAVITNFFYWGGVGRTDSIAWNAVVAASIEPLSRDTEGDDSKEMLCLVCDKYPLSSNNGIGSSSKEVLSTLTWDKGAGDAIQAPLWLLSNKHFVRSLVPKGCRVRRKTLSGHFEATTLCL